MSAISLFEEKQVRRAWNSIEEKWYFSIDDVVLALTDSANVKDYIKKLRKRDPALDSYWGTNCPPVEMIASDGKKRKIKAAHTESLFRIIQSIPSRTKTPSTAFAHTNPAHPGPKVVANRDHLKPLKFSTALPASFPQT